MLKEDNQYFEEASTEVAKHYIKRLKKVRCLANE